MKFYLSTSLFIHLLTSPDKKKIGSELENLLHEGHRFYTSVYSLLSLMNLLKMESADKWRMIIHQIEELVDEIFPITKTVLEFSLENTESTLLAQEELIAKINGMDEWIIYEEGTSIPSKSLPLRNFFGKADRKR